MQFMLAAVYVYAFELLFIHALFAKLFVRYIGTYDFTNSISKLIYAFNEYELNIENAICNFNFNFH